MWTAVEILSFAVVAAAGVGMMAWARRLWSRTRPPVHGIFVRGGSLRIEGNTTYWIEQTPDGGPRGRRSHT